jgi:NitT/TauT family transport system substrate-binding protein
MAAQVEGVTVIATRIQRGRKDTEAVTLRHGLARTSLASFVSFVTFVSFVPTAVDGCASRRSGAPHVRLAVGGQNQLVYLPTTLAQELGYYKDEGLDVELQDHAGGAKALQSLVGGSSDVVSGFYDHTIQMAAEGRAFVAFVNMLRFPGLVLVTSAQSAGTVTAAGSSSQMLLTYMLLRSGLTLEDVSITPIGTAATAIAAVEHGKVAAAMVSDPAFTIITTRNPGVRVLADLRTAAGVKAAVGADTYPSSVLYAKAEWIRENRETTSKLARAILRTLQWMHTHSPREIADKTPKTFRGEDDALYVDAVKSSMPMFSPDGTMDLQGAEAVKTLLAGSMEKVKAADIDLSKTFTNEFIHGR